MTHSTDAANPARPYRRILVPVDGSPQSDRALDEAIAIARACGGSLHLLSVLDETKHVNGFEPALTVIDEILPRARREVDELLQAARARATAAGVDAQVDRVDDGGQGVAALVAGRADAWGADLVVVGTHGRRGLDRMLLGSIAEGVLRRCPMPVLLVRTATDVEGSMAA